MRRGLIGIVAALLAATVFAADKPKYSHEEYFEVFEGTKTCLECHEDEAIAFFHSQHYQWKGETPAVTNAGGERLGKINTLNDFCTSPMPNWIGKVKNEEGKVVAKGCSKCHAGLGILPGEEATQEQLENIDCLLCHASGYNRDVYLNEDGSWEWRSILWKNPAGLNSVAKRISQPKRKMCLRCHAASGGGPNFKRGDIEYAMTDCEPSFDVHMASSGNDMACIDCHSGENHRMRGRGVDLLGSDTPEETLRCADGSCHGDAPHEARVLNHHAGRVACATCHIPVFAKGDPTDMVRDWSAPKYNEEKGKYGPSITFAQNAIPEYAWYNGTVRAYLMGEKAERLDDGSAAMVLPEGKRKDKEARIHPFKVHRGKMPILKDEEWLLPIGVEEFFADGDLDKAIRHGSAAAYGIEDPDYDWIDVRRYMGLFHEVSPAEEALRCLDCHGPDGRLDWKALGYDGDPLDEALD